jgi:endonuclease G
MVYKGVFPTTSEPVTILCKKRYVIGYSTTRKAPLWVAHRLTAQQVQAATSTRTGTFSIDPSLPPSQQSALSEYIGSGFDRGHQVPYEDLADDPQAAAESNLLTNVVPQFPTNNRGIWNALEGRVRKVALTRGEVYIVTGPLYDGKIQVLSKGTPVPTRLWKMVLVPHTTEAFTVIIPNADGLPASTMSQYFSTITALQRTNPLVNPLPARATFNNKRSFN